MADIHASLACNLDPNMLLAALPLLAAEEVAAMEWSFDALFQHREVPQWFTDLLGAFSREERLIGHGVFFSLFSGKWSAGQQRWLDELAELCTQFRFDHISEHFGFMTGADFHAGAPLSIPFTSTTLALGQDRLQRIQEVCRCPVGLENLAFAYSLDEVKKHGEFLERLLEPVNGFIILDLHNLYCQLHNFSVPFEQLIRLYPLERVREIHISGGSWQDSPLRPDKQVRRDTHDDRVPEAVFELLQAALPLCPQVKFVVLEQLGSGLATELERLGFQEDFRRMRRIIAHTGPRPGSTPQDFLPANYPSLGQPLEDTVLYQQQQQLSDILENTPDLHQAQALLAASSLAHSAWQTENWDPVMLDTAMQIAQKWKQGWASPQHQPEGNKS